MNYSRLKDLISENNLTIEKVCVKIGMTTSGFHASVKNNTMRISVIENIADILNIPVTTFFKEETSQGGHYNKPETNKTQFRERSSEYRNSLDTMIESNSKTLEALLEMRVELDKCRGKLAECEAEKNKLQLIQVSKGKQS